jgi:type I restriction enzyme S subunit
MGESLPCYRLGDIADVAWGDTKTTKASYVKGGYPAYSAKGLDGYLPHYDYSNTGIVVSAIGANCGRSWLARDKWSCIKNTIRILPRSELLDIEYLYWYFQSGNKWQMRGSAQPFISQTDARNLLVQLPPLSEQRAIAEVLGALDDKIEGNRKTASFIEELLAMEFALAQFDSIHNNPVALKDIIEVNPPRPRPNGKQAPYIDMNALPIDSALVNEYAVREPKSGSRFQNGDTVFARITPCLENGKAAFIDCLEGSSIGIGSTEFIVMRPKPSVPAQFAYFLARSERFREYAIKHMSGSSGRQRCPAESIGIYPIQQPDYNDLTAFGKKCDEGFSLMRSLLNESYLLALLRDTLLPKLLSGELRIKDTKQLLELTV